MGVITQGILGPISGRVGPVVGGSWKGIAYLRGYQAKVAQPNTAAQVAQKSNMSQVVAVAQTFLATIIKPLNDRFAVRMSGYNLFVQRNIMKVLVSGFPNFPLYVFSQGTLTGFETLAGTSVAPATDVDFTWDDNSGTGTAQASDEVFIAIVNLTNTSQGQIGGSAVRSDAAETVVLDDAAAVGDVLECFASFRTTNGFAVSNSEYIQIVST